MKEPAHKTALDLIRLCDYNGASRVVDAELDGCGEKGSSSDLWHLRFLRTDLIRLRGHTDEALAYLAAKETEFPLEGSDTPSLIGLKRTRGYCLGMLGKYGPSDGLLKEAEYLARDAGLLELLCEVWHCQAWFLYVRNEFETSDRLFREILRASEEIGGWYFRAIGLWGIGKNIMMRGHANNDALLLTEALGWFEQSHDLFAAAGRRMFAYGDMAVCYLDLGDDQKSLDLLEQLLPVYAEAGWVHTYQVTIANIGNVYRIRGDYLRAIDYYSNAIEYAREIKDPVSVWKWTYNLKLSYKLLRESVERLRSIPASM
jgi:tetratricopeptide (TPR) repeat protein